MLWNAIQQVIDFQLGPEHSTHMTLDQYDFGGRHNLWWPILHQGGTLHIKPSGGFDAAEIVRYVADHRITHVLWVPTMLHEILRVPRLGRYDLERAADDHLRRQPVSASMVLRAQEAFPGTDFLHVYGHAGGRRDGHVHPAAGRGAQARIGGAAVDPRGAPGRRRRRARTCRRASRARSRSAAPTVAAGYWLDPELTAERVRRRLAAHGRRRPVDSDGFLYFAGRNSNVIVSGGLTIFPAEIEQRASHPPGGAEVAVFGLPDEKWGETACAVIRRPPGASSTNAS